MARFILFDDYWKIRKEIKKVLVGEDYEANDPTPINLIRAEDTAISIMRGYLSGRFDCNAIFTAQGDDRNKMMIDMAITIALYKLYHITGMKDIPEHRKLEYVDAIDWLKEAGRGDIAVSDLPTALSDENEGDFIIQSRKPTDWKT